MELDSGQRRRADVFFIFLKKQNEAYFLESKIKKCSSCNGTGLSTSLHSEGHSWDGTSYCGDCKGIGYTGLSGGIQLDDLHYICSDCNGIGCSNCNQGIVDWVTHARGENDRNISRRVY